MGKKKKTRTANPYKIAVAIIAIIIFSIILMWVGIFLGFVVASLFCNKDILLGCGSFMESMLGGIAFYSMPIFTTLVSTKLSHILENILELKDSRHILVLMSVATSIVTYIFFIKV